MTEAQEPNPEERDSLRNLRPTGDDDRRGDRNPADSPAPRSPEPDADALREGEENLDRVKPY
jgi:hypothetical protein